MAAMEPVLLRLGTRNAVFSDGVGDDAQVVIHRASTLDAHDVESDAFLEEARSRLEDDGFVVLKGLLPSEDVVEAAALVLDAYKAKGTILEPTGSDTLRRDCGLGCVPFTEGRNELTHADAMLKVVEAPKLQQFFKRLFGEEAATFDYKWLRGVPRGVATGCHLDRVYMGRGSERLMTAWIPLGRKTPLDLGGLVMLEGSHKTTGPFAPLHATYGNMDVERDGLAGTGWFSEDPREISSRFGGDARWLAPPYYEAGDVVVFGLRTLHMSTANLTDRVRLSVDVRFQPASDPVDPRYVGEVRASDRVVSGAHAKDDAATKEEKVSIGDMKRAWGFAPYAAGA